MYAYDYCGLTWLAKSTDTGDYEELSLPRFTKTYLYLQVKHDGADKECSNYDIDIDYELGGCEGDGPSNYCQSAFEVPYSGYVIDDCVSADSWDWYLLSCPAGFESIEVSVEEIGGDVELYAFRECGTDPITEGYDTGDYEVLELGECAFGECYVEVYHPSQGSEWCDYSLTLDCACGGCGPDSVEDDTCEDAA